jgi:hypothetical protein
MLIQILGDFILGDELPTDPFALPVDALNSVVIRTGALCGGSSLVLEEG